MFKIDRILAYGVRSFCSGYLPVLLVTTSSAAIAFAAARKFDNPPDPDLLARQVVENEVRAQVGDDSLWHYREIDQEDGKVKTLEVCQTKQGEIDRLIAINGQPLSSKQATAEDQRIDRLVSDPDEWDSLQKKKHADADQERNLLRSFPQAFRFQYRGAENGLVTLSFAPNPDFRPATHAQLVFHHMQGTLRADRAQKRLAEIDGRLTSEVKFLGGLLGHLDQGGTFLVKQRDFGSGHWEMIFMNVQMDGKALFFKTIAVRQREVLSDFQPVSPATTPKKAAELLKHDVALSASYSRQ